MFTKAFTLIELLTVIAIISVLAAILFPVFAQAKMASKKITSLSNVKQIIDAEMIYQNDYDGYFVLSTQDFADSSCPLTGNCIDGLASPTLDWPDLLIPYIKTLKIFVDPGTGDPNGDFAASGPHSIIQNWGNDAQYGYNYNFLSPMQQTGNHGWSATGHIYGVGRSDSLGVHPANTAMFATAQGYASATSAAYQYLTPDDDWANPPGAMQYTLPALDRVVVTSPGCFMGTAPFWTCGWVYNTPAGYGGPISSNVRVYQPYGEGIVGWVDGHASVMTPNALAAGTDFGTSTWTGGETIWGSTGAVITNLSTYLWSLDGTINDLK